MAEQRSNTQQDIPPKTTSTQQDETIITQDQSHRSLTDDPTTGKESTESEDQNRHPSGYAIEGGKDMASTSGHQDRSRQSFTDDPAPGKESTTGGDDDVIPSTTQEPQKTTSATNQVRHLSLYKEILSPLAKGVQSVPIFAMSPTQAKKFADSGFVKPHTSKAELSLSKSRNVKASGAAELREKLQSLTEDLNKVTSANKVEPSKESSKEMAVVQEGLDSSSCNSSEGEAVVTVHMQSLSLSALDHQKNNTDEGKGDMSNTTTNILGTSSTLSDTTLLVIEKKTHQQGKKARSKSQSFLKLSSSSLKLLSLKSCMGKGVTSSDEDDKSGYKSSLDETANGRSDENESKKKKKQKKKRKLMARKSTSDTTKAATTESEILDQPPNKMNKPIHETPFTPFTPFSNIRKDGFGQETPSNFLEWDNYGENMLPSTSSRGENMSHGSFGDEEITKSGGNIQYHKDMLAIFDQIEKEGGPKLTQMLPANTVDEEKLGLLMTILHIHQKKEDVQKLLGVTQDHLWETQAELENLQSHLVDMDTCNKDAKMENMKMEEKLNRSGSQLLQIRTELETKITVLEREIERLDMRLQEQASTTSGSQAEIRVLQFQNSQLHDKLFRTSEELDKKRLLSQSFTQFAEYLKFRLLLLEEKLITEKQQMHKMIKTISSANSELVTTNGSSSNVSIDDVRVEFGNVPENENPVAEVKCHIVLVQQIIEAVGVEIGHLEDAVKVNLEESKLEKADLQAELEFLKSEQDATNQKEIQRLQERCLQLCEDNNRLEDMCIQNAREMETEKEKYQDMCDQNAEELKAEKEKYEEMCIQNGNELKAEKEKYEGIAEELKAEKEKCEQLEKEAQQMSYGQIIIDHVHLEDDSKQRLEVAQEECTQAKKDVTVKIQEVSSLQKKCSELISIESQLRKELEHMREESQHKIGKLEENQTLAISSLQQQRTKQDTDKQDHEAQMVELKKALQQVCESLKETTQQNLELMRYCHHLEKEQKEQEDYIKEMECAVSESKRQLDYTRMQLHHSQKEVKELHSQCAVTESENKQETSKMQQEMDVLTTEHQQYQSQLHHHKRLVEELQAMVKKQEIQHDEVLEELLQRNVEHDKAVEQVKESTKCIQEMQDQYSTMHGEKENLRGMLECHVQRLLQENQQVKAQLHDSQQLVNEQHAKCQKLSQDLKSATAELTKRDHTIENLHQELAVSVATQKTEFDTRCEENAAARASLEGRLCRSECSEKELKASEHSLQVQLAVQMQTVKLLEEERRKNAGLEQKLQAMENELRENNKSLALSSSSSEHQANEIKMLRDAVNATRNQLKELIEDKMHTALLGQLKEKQDLTNKLMEALSVLNNYDQYFKEDNGEKESLALRNHNLQAECDSLTSLLKEERDKYKDITHQMEELHGNLVRENQEKLRVLQEKERLLDWNENIFHHAGNITRSLTSLSTGQNSELVQLKENSGRLASDIQLILRLPSNGGIGGKDKSSSIIDKWTNPCGFLTASQQSQENK
ncbi:uncharacterized protein [Amphiura filiformis]|uniref:uncharacterized protein n=1 Tax=Amphiura filiformis TaxID=82378 RepID=UPI003B225698